MVSDGRNEGNRGAYIKAARAGLISVLFLLTLSSYCWCQSVTNQSSQTIQADSKPEPPITVTASSQKLPLCGAAKTRDDAEYCEQWYAAKATQKQATWALVQSISSVIGIAALIATLIYTAQSVKASQKSAKAAEDAVKHAVSISEIEMRPWVFVHIAAGTAEAEDGGGNECAAVVFEIAN